MIDVIMDPSLRNSPVSAGDMKVKLGDTVKEQLTRSLMIFSVSRLGSFATNGASPVSISNRSAPKLHQSTDCTIQQQGIRRGMTYSWIW